MESPEPDSVRLFIGQVPKDMEADELRKIFEPFGKILDISILKDKSTGQHKGCAFLTFLKKASADTAIQELHNIKILRGGKAALQVKYSNERKSDLNDQISDWKLFIGMVPKNASENHVRVPFEPYGEIEEIRILRGTDGESKGCAFVKYKTRQQALAALNDLNGNHHLVVDGVTSSNALVVRFAAPLKYKQGQSSGSQNSPTSPNSSFNVGNSMAVNPFAFMQQMLAFYTPQQIQALAATYNFGVDLNGMSQLAASGANSAAINSYFTGAQMFAQPYQQYQQYQQQYSSNPVLYTQTNQNTEDRKMKKGSTGPRMHPYGYH